MRAFRPILAPLGATALGAAFLMVALAGCQPKQEPTAGNTAPGDSTARDSLARDSLLSITGTVHHSDLEGGFWLIRGDDGTSYDPMSGLPEAFREEGLRVAARLRPRPDVMGTHQAGTIVEVVEIRRR
jgi:hypothetical protein